MWARIRVPWSRPDHAIFFNALPQAIRMDVFLKPQVEVVCNTSNRTTGASGGTATGGGGITNAVLRTQWIHLPEPIRNMIFNSVQTDIGRVTKIWHYERHLREIATGSTSSVNSGASSSLTMNLTNIRNDCFGMIAYIQQQENVTGQGTINPYFFLPTRITMYDLGNAVTDTFEYNDFYVNSFTPYSISTAFGPQSFNMTGAWSKWTDKNKAFPDSNISLLNNSMYLPLCLPTYFLDSKWNCYGSRTIAKYGSPQLKFEFEVPATMNDYCIVSSRNIINPWGDVTSATSSNYFFNVIGYCHNLMLHVKGDIRPFIAV